MILGKAGKDINVRIFTAFCPHLQKGMSMCCFGDCWAWYFGYICLENQQAELEQAEEG